MKLKELYDQTPVARHGDIRVIGGQVFVRDAGGDTAEYLLTADGELWLVRSDKKLKADVDAIRQKLGA